jgi:hypothetical protein
MPKFSFGVWYFFPSGGRFHEAYVPKGKMEDIVTIHHESSKDLVKRWTEPVDMVVVDGNHLREYLENDIQLLNHLRPGGYALFHDFTACIGEVAVTMRDWVAQSDEWSLIVEPNCLSMGIIQRKFSLSPKECFTATLLAQAVNPNGMHTPFQMTDPRACGAIKSWNGKWFPDLEHFHDTQAEGEEVAKRIMEYEKRTGKILENMEDLT